MKVLRFKEIVNSMGGQIISGDENLLVKGFSIDSRKVKRDDLFIPIIGENNDGHQFIMDAIEMGCTSFVVDEKHAENLKKYIITEKIEGISYGKCPDTTTGLQKLAKHYLNSLSIKKIAVTGSTGKTTTKEMLFHICSEEYKTQRNIGNFNNHIGLPLTVLGFLLETQVGILEMGMDKRGEIELLSEIVKPDIGIITNIGTAHIERLGSREAIFEAKMEITSFFDENNILVVNGENDFLDLNKEDYPFKVIKVGESGKCDIVISDIGDFGEKGIIFSLETKGNGIYERQDFKLNIPGRHNAYNAALAIAAASSLGISLEKAAVGLSKMKASDKRLSIKGKNGIKIIDDTYNASVDSMKAAIDLLQVTTGIRKIAILGDMLEMGEKSLFYHKEIGEYLKGKNIDLLITVGRDSKHIATDEFSSLHFDNKDQLIKAIDGIIGIGDVILLKGSRGIKLDLVVKHIMED